jgi:hypothetical protein
MEPTTGQLGRQSKGSFDTGSSMKTDQSIKNIVVASIRRHGMNIEARPNTRLLEHGDPVLFVLGIAAEWKLLGASHAGQRRALSALAPRPRMVGGDYARRTC